MAKNKEMGNVPNLRFEGFTKPWDIVKLGDVVSNKSPKFNPSKAITYIKCIELEHISVKTGELLGFIDGSESGSIKNVFCKGDVLFGKLRPYLRKYMYAPFDGVCSSEIWVLTGKSILNSFLYQIVQTEKFIDLANQSSGSKMPRADWSVVQDGDFSFPTRKEQEKISNFLALVNERISTQNKIIEELKCLKHSVSKSIFSHKIKLKDENGLYYPEWNYISLDSICEIKKGVQFSKENLEEYGSYPCLNGGISPSGFSDKYNTNEDTITISEGGNSCGYVNFMKTKFWLGGHCYKIFNLKNTDLAYLYHLLKFNEQNIMSLRVGSGLPNIQLKDLKKFVIKVSMVQKEQTKIASFLSSIDTKIDVEFQLMEKLKKQKQYLLSNLFI